MIIEINTAHHYKFRCPYIATWKHLTSSLWMNIAEFIFWLLHIYNTPTLSILTPFHSPFTPFANYAYLSPNYENTTGECINFFVDLADTIDISINLYIPNLALLQLLFICKLKVKTMFIVGSMICYVFSSFFLCGFYISHPSSSSFVLEFAS
jgi:hypothetical protein